MKRRKSLVPPPENPSLTPFDDGVAVLRFDGQVAGHVATTLGYFRTLRKQQHWVWFVVVWTDGRREQPEEDYFPWTFVTEIQNGYFDAPDGVRYEATWVPEPDRERTWAELGLTHDQF